MTTDRELLELAAKAAGFDIDWKKPLVGNGEEYPVKLNMKYRQLESWTPLENDGDALRLAVALSMDIEINQISVSVFAGYRYPGVTERCEGPDSRAKAVRLAITKAAAEIGRAMS